MNNQSKNINKLKDIIKELIKTSLEEISTTGGIAGYQTPFAFGKTKNVTAGLPGYSKIGDSDTGTLDEKKKEKGKSVKPAAPAIIPNKIDSSDKAVISKREKLAGQRGDKEGSKLYKKLGHLAKIQGVK